MHISANHTRELFAHQQFNDLDARIRAIRKIFPYKMEKSRDALDIRSISIPVFQINSLNRYNCLSHAISFHAARDVNTFHSEIYSHVNKNENTPSLVRTVTRTSAQRLKISPLNYY